MKIEFEFVNKETVNIIGINHKDERHQIGQIFTPSSSGRDVTNAIQICGFSEAFDLWGCGVFANFAREDNVTINRNKRAQVKDIQLQFDFETQKHHSEHFDMNKNCLKCYNLPCTCETKGEYLPYRVKRSLPEVYLEKVKGT